MAITEAIPSTGVEDLDPAGVLACAGEAETAERRAGLGKLELALQWCVLHPATTESGAAVWGDAGLPGLADCEESLGGDGCPTVAALRSRAVRGCPRRVDVHRDAGPGRRP